MHKLLTSSLIFLICLSAGLADSPEAGYVIVEDTNQSSFMKGFPPPPEKVITRFRGGLNEDAYRWAFQNMSKINFVEPVSRGNGKATAYPTPVIIFSIKCSPGLIVQTTLCGIYLKE